MLYKQKEMLLEWLQEFYHNDIREFSKHFPENVPDEDMDIYEPFKHVAMMPGLLNLSVLDNPGWSLEFLHKNTQYTNYKQQHFNINSKPWGAQDWLFINKKDNIFDVSGGPLYLSVALEIFKRWTQNKPIVILNSVEDLNALREQLKSTNPLLHWLEEFLLSSCYWCYDGFCDGDTSIGLMSIQSGWIMAITLHDLDWENKPFDKIIIQEEGGIVECYTIKERFIIRTHHHGLITGIKIFKDWVTKYNIETENLEYKEELKQKHLKLYEEEIRLGSPQDRPWIYY